MDVSENSQKSSINNDNDKKKKKRDERAINQLLQQVDINGSEQDQVRLISLKYSELLQENKLTKEKVTEFQKKYLQCEKERSHLQSENNKLVLAKDRLEGLCRELQKVNKTVKEESSALSKANEERRLEVSAAFQTKISEIQTQISEYHDQNILLREENEKLTGKIKEILALFESRTMDMENCLKEKDLLVQQLQVKWKERENHMDEERLIHKANLEKCQEELLSYQSKCLLLEQLDKKYREQTDYYKEKYEEFHRTLTQSADVYMTCKTEMDKMSKKMRSLEKECLQWKSKCDNSEMSVLQMAKEKIENEALVAGLKTKVTTLENLCRTLQTQLRSATSSSASKECETAEVGTVSGDLADTKPTVESVESAD